MVKKCILLSLCLSTFSSLSLFVGVSTIKAANISQYLFPPNAPGISMSSGEYFKPIPDGQNCWKIQKSTDAQYYEKFCENNGVIYHVEDTTWATTDGNVTCNETGNDAILTYEGGSTPWVTSNMNVGDTYTSSGRVVGIDKVTKKQCNTAFNGAFTRKIKMITQGCVVFPGGTGSNNAIGLEIETGPGAGEQFFYDSTNGWIGFDRGTDETGAYAEGLSDIKDTSSCYQVKFSSIGKNCPIGYTCPIVSSKPTVGEKITIKKRVAKGSDPRDALKGFTGPETGKFQTPDLSQESNFFKSNEFFERALTPDQQQAFRLRPKQMEGQLGHPGCGNIDVGGANAGPTETDQQTTKFPTNNAYNTLLLTNEFWRCTIQGGYNCKLKFQTTQPEYEAPPTNSGDCQENTGESIDQTVIPNSQPTNLGVIGNVLNFVRGIACLITKTDDCMVDVTFSFQQFKFIPAEKTFDDQTVNENGFLNWFKGDDFSYEKPSAQRDEDEKSEYRVVNDVRPVTAGDRVGTTFEGQADFQKDTLNMVKSLFPAEMSDDITGLAGTTSPINSINVPTNVPVAVGLLQIPYRDASIQITADSRNRVITRVKQIFPRSLIEQNWDTVVTKTTSAGINPAFALAVWIEESGAGHFSNNFSCPPSETDFGKSLDCFVNTTLRSPSTPNFEGWAANYCGKPAAGQPICGVNEKGDNNSNFLTNLNYWYNQFAQQNVNGVN